MRNGNWHETWSAEPASCQQNSEEVIQPQLILRKHQSLQAFYFHFNINRSRARKLAHLSFLSPSYISFPLPGKAVFLARDKHHLTDLCHLIRHDTPYLFQEYVKESHGRDVRVVLVGGRVIGSMLRCSTDGRMQSNCSLGRQTPKSQ